MPGRLRQPDASPHWPEAPWAAGLLGVLGGMGPMATCRFFAQIIRHTPAERDQDHVPVIVHSVPQIPDRSSFLEKRGPDPWPALRDGALRLADSGASIIVITCNTAHYWFDDLEKEVPVRWLHIADAVATDLPGPAAAAPPVVGLLATTGTVAAQVYPRRLARLGLRWMAPDAESQSTLVDAGIRLVKAGRTREAAVLLLEAERRLARQGAMRIVLGCTEIPLALESAPSAVGVDRIDSLDALARYSLAAMLRPPPAGSPAEPAPFG